MKSYYCYTEDTDISYPKITNDLVKNPVDKHANKEISKPFHYLELKKPCQ